jgi:aspartyl-tRNA(Asn)/glutamyl-tRNA(Gln) amidotransferase subunit A
MPIRFREWAALDIEERGRVRETAAHRARVLDGSLNAYVALSGSAATGVAGPLRDMPYAAKDIFTAPDRLPAGGLRRPLRPGPHGCADALTLLDQAGGCRIGYTALTELAYEPSGYNAVHGRVRNPWNLDFISGGSSSGSAAAVASGSVVIALGSDTGGSLRIPAHCCGVTAWKPTYGAVSMRGAMLLAPTLDTIGLLGRSAADMTQAAEILATQLPGTPSIRSAVVLRDMLDAAHPSICKACEAGIEAIAAAGVALERRDGGALLSACDEPVFTIMQGEAARCHPDLIGDESVGPVLRKRLAKGLTIDDQTLGAAIARRSALAASFLAQVLDTADIAVLPVMAIRTPPAAECDPGDAAFSARTLYELSRLTRFVNMLGLPAVAFPVGVDDRNMPVGLQIVGRPHSDRALLALAAKIQTLSDWHARIPHAVASLLTPDTPIDIA